MPFPPLGPVRRRVRVQHMSYRTEEVYLNGIRCRILRGVVSAVPQRLGPLVLGHQEVGRGPNTLGGKRGKERRSILSEVVLPALDVPMRSLRRRHERADGWGMGESIWRVHWVGNIRVPVSLRKPRQTRILVAFGATFRHRPDMT